MMIVFLAIMCVFCLSTMHKGSGMMSLTFSRLDYNAHNCYVKIRPKDLDKLN